jgi:hypothetical protein
MTAKKIAVVIVLFLAIVGGLAWYDRNPARDHIGHVVSCSDRFPFADREVDHRKTADQQAEVLDYGLQNVRGLAYDPAVKMLFLAEGDRSLLVGNWETEQKSQAGNVFTLRYPDEKFMCQDERCGDADQRGLAVWNSQLYSAEHGRGRIAVRTYPVPKPGTYRDPKLIMDDVVPSLLQSSSLAEDAHSLSGPAGVAAVNGAVFITDDRPWPGAPTAPSSFDSADYAAWTGKGAARPFGGIYLCDKDSCKLISGSLRHPSGVAAAGLNGPIFVAEADGQEIRWPIFVKPEKDWIEAGSLGSMPISGNTLPTFLGLALFDPCNGTCNNDDSRKMVFASGPGGLYVFDTRGTILGRVMFDEPVSGIALTGKEVYEQPGDLEPLRYRLYLVVGHMLCSLTFRDPSERHKPDRAPSEPMVQPTESGSNGRGADKPSSTPKPTLPNPDLNKPCVPKPSLHTEHPPREPNEESSHPPRERASDKSALFPCEPNKDVHPQPDTDPRSNKCRGTKRSISGQDLAPTKTKSTKCSCPPRGSFAPGAQKLPSAAGVCE